MGVKGLAVRTISLTEGIAVGSEARLVSEGAAQPRLSGGDGELCGVRFRALDGKAIGRGAAQRGPDLGGRQVLQRVNIRALHLQRALQRRQLVPPPRDKRLGGLELHRQSVPVGAALSGGTDGFGGSCQRGSIHVVTLPHAKRSIRVRSQHNSCLAASTRRLPSEVGGKRDAQGARRRKGSPMKRIIVTGFVTALAVVGLAGTANAAPADAACFGQIHKAVNAGAVGLDNVGQLVQSMENKGQGKNALARELAASGFCD